MAAPPTGDQEEGVYLAIPLGMDEVALSRWGRYQRWVDRVTGQNCDVATFDDPINPLIYM